jgi:hypothetical protein
LCHCHIENITQRHDTDFNSLSLRIISKMLIPKVGFAVHLLLVALSLPSLVLAHPTASATANATAISQYSNWGQRWYPTRTVANVTVVDTPIVRAAEELARQHALNFTYKHIMRSWLFGALIVQHNATLRATIDPEVHAVAAILHDLGWDHSANSPYVSSDRRFEVDGAIAARDFIQNHEHGKAWDERRVQLVWDAIALHSQQSIAFFKELDVQVVAKGILLDFEGPRFGVTDDEYNTVLQEFPRNDLDTGFNDTMIWLCQTKPASTYGEFWSLTSPSQVADHAHLDTWMQPWGDHYVSNYTAKGHTLFDTVLNMFSE